ncbi:metal-dependent transcriptional regulator [bacterium]|nr:metal-dependent transcriptional regulator [bacterium]
MPESRLSESLEDYLEAIYLLSRKDEEVRVAEIAEALGFSKPSVSEALTILESKGFVEHEKYRGVRLTPEGEELAKRVYERHKTLSIFLTRILGVPPARAVAEACRIEHTISEDTYDRLRRFVDEQMSQISDGLSRLSELSPGERGEVVRVQAPGWFRHRLLEMGFIAGEIVTLERVAPLRDPMEFVIKGYHVSLRREEAARVVVRRIENDTKSSS